MNYQDMRMEFQEKGRQQVILIGMLTGSPRIVSNQHVEALFIHGNTACVEECLIIMEMPSHDCHHYPTDI